MCVFLRGVGNVGGSPVQDSPARPNSEESGSVDAGSYVRVENHSPP